jgi:hypothetical protein
MSVRYTFFSKGQVVPQWVEKTENCTLIFRVPAMVEKDDDGMIHVYPMDHDNDDMRHEFWSIFRALPLAYEGKPKVTGCPTQIYMNGIIAFIKK